MEHLWSTAVATGRNRRQIGLCRKRLSKAKSVAVGCDQLPWPQNGKEAVPVSVTSTTSIRPARHQPAWRAKRPLPSCCHAALSVYH